MNTLPPPAGPAVSASPPVPPTDPWVEQARRRAAHQRARRRLQMQWLSLFLVLFVVAAAAFVWFSGVLDRDNGSAADASVPASTAAPATTVTAPAVTVSADELVRIDEVWLVDRGDDVYDWGVTVLVPTLAPTRSGVEIEVRLIAADGGVVEAVIRTLDGVDVDSPGAAIGQVIDPSVPPVRIEFDVAVGVASNDAAYDEYLDMRSLTRAGDTVTGLVRTSRTEPVSDVSAVLVWRDDVGDVVGMAVQPIDRIRPGIDARFELDLAEMNVPDGRPDDVFWVPEN